MKQPPTITVYKYDASQPSFQAKMTDHDPKNAHFEIYHAVDPSTRQHYFVQRERMPKATGPKKFVKVLLFVELTEEEAADYQNIEGKLDAVASQALDGKSDRERDWIVEEVLEGESLVDVVERFC